MRRAPRLPHARRGPSMHLRVPGSLLHPAAPALVAGLSLADDVRANAGSYLTVSTFHKIGATPAYLSRSRYGRLPHRRQSASHDSARTISCDAVFGVFFEKAS